jgi:hypothetical protein
MYKFARYSKKKSVFKHSWSEAVGLPLTSRTWHTRLSRAMGSWTWQRASTISCSPTSTP